MRSGPRCFPWERSARRQPSTTHCQGSWTGAWPASSSRAASAAASLACEPQSALPTTRACSLESSPSSCWPWPPTCCSAAWARSAAKHPWRPIMIFRQLFEPESSTYTYLLACPETRKAVLIDPVLETIERDLAALQELDLELAYTLETH